MKTDFTIKWQYPTDIIFRLQGHIVGKGSENRMFYFLAHEMALDFKRSIKLIDLEDPATFHHPIKLDLCLDENLQSEQIKSPVRDCDYPAKHIMQYARSTDQLKGAQKAALEYVKKYWDSQKEVQNNDPK